ncbi:MAG: LysR substrate-binding domain-containing protein [Burkholderiales bacterium]|nr:LysR substrate-binding domain-containing protein [Burkholderiales bacterium]
MEIRHLNYFLKLTETSSFTRAAAALHITQSTLSHQIKQLEQQLGCRLFDRIGRQIRLTDPGRVLQGHAIRIVREVDAGINAIAALDGLIQGQLTVGVFRTFGSSPLPHVFAKFGAQYPGVQIKVRQLSLIDIERELLEGSMSLAIGYLPASSEKVETEPLYAVPLAVVSNRNHPLYKRSKISIKDLHGQDLVLLSREFPLRQLIDDAFSRHDVKPRIIMEMNSSEAALSTVRCGPLAAILTDRVLDKTDTLSSIRLRDSTLSRTAAIFWARDNYRPRAAIVLAEMVKQVYKNQRRK